MSTKPNLYNMPIKKLKANLNSNELVVNNKKNEITESLNASLSITKKTAEPFLDINNIDKVAQNKSLEKTVYKNLPDEISAGAIIYNLYNHSVLLVQGKNKYFGFPKGHIEKNETEFETMKREVAEETGLILDDIRYIVIDKPIVQKFYLKRKYIYYDDCAPEVNRINIFYVIMINQKEEPKLVKQESEILKLGWYPIYCAITTMKKTNSNQITMLEEALVNINFHIAKKISLVD